MRIEGQFEAPAARLLSRAVRLTGRAERVGFEGTGIEKCQAQYEKCKMKSAKCELIAGRRYRISAPAWQPRHLVCCVSAMWLVVCPAAKAQPEPVIAPPRMLLQEAGGADEPARPRRGYAIMRLPGGSFAFYDRYRPQAGPLVLPDRTGRKLTLLPYLPERVMANQAIAASGVLAGTQVILTPDDQVTNVFVRAEALDRKTAAEVGLRRYLDVWIKHCGLDSPAGESRIWRGYNGSQMEYQQLAGGRILVPYGSMLPHARPVPPTGRHATIIQFSDDQGRTWTESDSKLTSPCYPNFNGNNEGACEPAIEALGDGRIWMLMRTQAGFLYESWSTDRGTTWTKASASRFNTSTGPPNIMRHQNGWLVVSWNNCEMPPRHQGQGVYGGRDALHIAVSADEGKTWRGFREIYLDHRRNDNPASSGDRGTAYPLGAYTATGKIVILAGQGTGGRNPILIDPQWIVQTEAHTDFSDGLQQWSVYKQHGPAARWWRARAVGCELVANPTDPSVNSLHIRHADEKSPDGAVWNFPNGWRGTLTARVMINPDYQGGRISLNDRMFDPTDDAGETLAVFGVKLGDDGSFGTVTLTPETWHDLTLDWDLRNSRCRLQVDGEDAGVVKIKNETLNGVSYVRFRSMAHEIDRAGFLVDRVDVTIDDPFAPTRTATQQAEHEQRYIEKMVPRWSQ